MVIITGIYNPFYRQDFKSCGYLVWDSEIPNSHRYEILIQF